EDRSPQPAPLHRPSRRPARPVRDPGLRRGPCRPGRALGAGGLRGVRRLPPEGGQPLAHGARGGPRPASRRDPGPGRPRAFEPRRGRVPTHLRPAAAGRDLPSRPPAILVIRARNLIGLTRDWAPAAAVILAAWALLFLPQLAARQVFVRGDAAAFRPFSEFSRQRWRERHVRTFW